MKNWKTTIGGALSALGTSIAALATVGAFTEPDYRKLAVTFIVIGGLLSAFGKFFALLFAQDAAGKDGDSGGQASTLRCWVWIFVMLSATSLIVGMATGCKTQSNPGGTVSVAGHPVDPVKTGKAVRVAAKFGALETIRSKPETRDYFALASVAIGAVVASGNYSTSNVVDTINAQVGNETVSTAIADAIGLYQDFFGDLVTNKLESYSPYTVPVLTGLAAGLAEAVDMTKP